MGGGRCGRARGSDIDITLYRVDAQGEGNSANAVQVLQIVMQLMKTTARRALHKEVGAAANLQALFDSPTWRAMNSADFVKEAQKRSLKVTELKKLS